MEQFKHLDSKTVEIAGIAASIDVNSRHSHDYKYKKCIREGCPNTKINKTKNNKKKKRNTKTHTQRQKKTTNQKKKQKITK